MKIVFPYLAQTHQIPHSLPLAAALAARPEFEVHIACSTEAQETLARRLAALYPEARLHFDRFRTNPLRRWLSRLAGRGLPPKKRTLADNRGYLAGFAAALVPERTSLVLRKLLPELRLVYTQHGPPGRAVTYADDIGQFDYVLVHGRHAESRMLREGLVHPGRYHCGGYAKFDLIGRLPAQSLALFAEPRPTVLYNPHFEAGLSSWPDWGTRVLDFFAASREYNLIFAPHVRLFDGERGRLPAALRRYQGLPNIHLDTGSYRSIDMSYVLAADLYLGDVSSQVSEFLVRPRPCVFLNAHRVTWQDSPDYRFWQLGPVVDDLATLGDTLASARARHADWLPQQRDYFRESFGVEPGPEGQRAAAEALAGTADAIARYLQGPRA